MFCLVQDDSMCSDNEKICGGECFPEFLYHDKIFHEDAKQRQRDPDFCVHGSVYSGEKPWVELGLHFLHYAFLPCLADTE